MNPELKSELELELEQHQISDSLGYGFVLDRRKFFQLMGGGVLVCLAAKTLAQESGRAQRGGEEALPSALSAWLHIGETGAVTVYTGKAELGQNIRTSLSQQIAEELHAPVESITLVMADTDLTPFDMGTFGSRTTPYHAPQLRNVAATARDVLLDMAAKRWNAEAAGLVADNGKIINPKSKQSISYGELTRGQELVKVMGEDPPLTPPAEWKVAGKPLPKVDGRAFVTGKHEYTSDLKRPGMLYGKVLRPSAFKATLASLDSADAEKMAGVTVVHDGNFVGVAAASEFAASRALAELNAKWDAPQQPSEAELFDLLKKTAHSERGGPYVVGSVADAMKSADHTVSQTYTVAYIAHSPLEPRAAVAEWNGGKLTCWTGTQRPFAVRDELAEAFRLSKDQVRVIVPDTGSAYGGKHTGDAAVEAARLAKAAGKPVKVIWTREEELTWAYFRPAGVIEAKSGAKADGTIVAWEFDNYNSGPSAIRTPYNIANQRIEFHASDSPLRQGSYRGLAATANHFAREVHMDELAHAVGMDPLEFRLKNIADPRLRAVFEAAASKFEWGKEKSTAERGFGLAGGIEKGGYVATCAEVAVDRAKGSVRIVRVAEAFECGAIVNPNGLRNQVMGSMVQGIGGALFEAIHFDNGRILNPHFAQYRLPRFSDTPQIDVVLLDRKDLPPAGAGETPIVGMAPAVGNAIFNATGIRLRSLPMIPNGLPKA